LWRRSRAHHLDRARHRLFGFRVPALFVVGLGQIEILGARFRWWPGGHTRAIGGADRDRLLQHAELEPNGDVGDGGLRDAQVFDSSRSEPGKRRCEAVLARRKVRKQK
jgi:hypothetical protein